MNGFMRARMGFIFGTGLGLSLVGCAALTPSPTSTRPLRAEAANSGDVRDSEPVASASKPAPETGPEATEQNITPALSPETLAAIDSFLARTAQFESDTPESADRPKPENERNDPSAHQQRTQANGQENAVWPPGATVETRIEPAPANRGGSLAANGVIEIEAPVTARTTPAIPKVLAVSVRAAGGSPLKATPEPEAERTAANAPANAQAPQRQATVADLFNMLRNREEGSSASWVWKVSLAEHLLIPPSERESPTESENSEQPAWQNLAALIDSVAEMQTGNQTPSKAARVALERLQREVSETIDPEVSAVALCRKVVTFGVYEEAATEDFVAGRPIQTIVYSEIRHLRTQELENEIYETRLAARLELFTADGTSVWTKEEPDVVDRCRRVRSDFFIAQRISLPVTLSAGDYILKIFVEDKIAGRATESSLPVRILSAASLVRG